MGAPSGLAGRVVLPGTLLRIDAIWEGLVLCAVCRRFANKKMEAGAEGRLGA
jgi:hypothetical protein